MRDPQLTGYGPNLTPGVTPEEVILVETRSVRCDGTPAAALRGAAGNPDGGGGALGHPAIFLRIERQQVTCPYCSRTYRLKEGAGDDHHH
ncbi:zinc-finger domain-containing protein [Rubritepida flocculans]|jgi:uncharacterized Zn-finger protein|uniref:zinc-finger domain-containing protein n=1 Tax=Rubritepida flocculans TaxID=182403 RepID=UPI0003F7C047|nr:zinc-finger domain-containing protein [Rubritepida flocculans]